MTTVVTPRAAGPEAGRATVLALARADARRYARHPLFLGVAALLLLGMADGVRQQERNASPMNGALLIAFLLGVFGFVVAHRLTTSLQRTGDLAATAPVGSQQRTVALLIACLVPFAAGCVFAVYMLVSMAIWPPVGIPASAHVAWFRDESDVAVLATLIALGPVAALGGPLLGVAVARWAPFRGSALVGVVTLVFLSAMPSAAPTPWRLLTPWPTLYDEHANEREQLTDSSLIARRRPGLGAGLPALPLRTGGGGRTAPRPTPPPCVARDRRDPGARHRGFLPAGRDVNRNRLPFTATLPWPVVGAAAAAVLLVLAVAVIPPGPGVPLFALHLTEVLLAGGAAYALDDAAATLTDVTPRALWRRRLPRLAVSAATIAVATGVIALVLHQQGSLPPLPALVGEILVLCLLAVAAAVLARRHEPEPGALVAPVVALLGLAAVVAGSILGEPLFATDEGAAASRPIWLGLGAVAVLTIVLGSRDPGAAAPWRRSPPQEATIPGRHD